LTLPFELVCRDVIPYIRALVVQTLNDAGLSQGRIAGLLNISQPMVSKYLRMNKSVIYGKLEGVGVPLDEVDQVINDLTNSLLRSDVLHYVRLFTAYLNSLLSRGLLCRTHLGMVKALPTDCNICSSLFTGQADFLAEEVNDIFRRIKALERATSLIPEVGMNIVAASPNASSIMDTVGFSGRIFRVGGSIRAVGPVVRGGSKHTAKVLLEVLRRMPEIRYCIVVRYSDGCVEAISRSYGGVLLIKSHKSEEELLGKLRKEIESFRERLSAIVDLGGPGFEAVIYLMGRSPNDLISKVKACAAGIS